MLPIEAVLPKARGQRCADILRTALTSMAWPFISLPLALAFPVQIYDLKRRGMIARRPRMDRIPP